ncbi:tetratricopeptide repeat protein [Tuwongella immobilis]|uniref:Tetratricopeptide repeat protein n=1 Tax=Tuwongella immobilis TaxID=692036 RepID=A0A6C2YX58_9BACT|nr:hypothetical protein [Tuwongella immobilis]VIP05395.1 tpr repeat-containing protein : Uncharacterized protein OS=Singulisphaera acidiphila (strain ATCC BAA-1392 / DSM 18658 / VKM B-2454 / MOB10) GN=Sinac_3537 PE=4 SV=1: TPR_19 [Tuwongella immobilis]VTS08146.1 tpr repeat-containing protein : Uncharacterized protein OS=Singulisphaera acidiphila (strain ATCC BAA-1392 / DSM 18658 / VKM B-2454 / MOB10) GN=Sinac_3537 PE=4 SV=1: TPR_19 [Tuwongella immobilis]
MSRLECMVRTALDCYERGDLFGAQRLAREGLQRDSDHGGLWQLLGVVSFQLEQWSDALEAFEQASVRIPLNAVARFAWADLCLRIGQESDARTMLRFLAIPGQCPTAMLPDLSRLLGRVGEYRRALQVCKRLIQRQPWYHPAYYGAAFYLRKLGKSPRRIALLLEAAHRLAPTAATYRISLAMTRCRQRQFAAAVELLRPVDVTQIRCLTCLKQFRRAAMQVIDFALAARIHEQIRVLSQSPPASDSQSDPDLFS